MTPYQEYKSTRYRMWNDLSIHMKVNNEGRKIQDLCIQ